jgi:S-adenosylmethionine-diacylglycerol 3-amino-3-carboxypropyl transferase
METSRVRNNLIQFAVVREDPELEAEILRKFSGKRALLIASGGCTALHLLTQFPELALSLVDFNPAQLSLVQRKLDAMGLEREAMHANFGVENTASNSLVQCGNFESLFRSLRFFLNEFVLDPAAMRSIFEDSHAADHLVDELVGHRYWPVAFKLFFHDSLLNAMFGTAATQHAEKDSYPGYFQRAMERGLARRDRCDNYFLHHIFIGSYLARPSALPTYMAQPLLSLHRSRVKYFEGTLQQVDDLASYDLLSLSNIFDWMDRDQITDLVKYLCDAVRPGAVVLIRQLNNDVDLAAMFGQAFQSLTDLERDLLDRDRSLFYSRIRILRRI